MKLSHVRIAIFLTIFAVSTAPLHTYAKVSEHTPQTLQHLKENLPAKVKEQTDRIRQKVEELRAKREQQVQQTPQQTPPQEIQQPAIQQPEQIKQTEVKKQLCTENQAGITNLIAKSNTEKQLAYDTISRISESAQRFYASHNLSISNYDSLVLAVEQTNVAAKTSIDAQRSVPSFSCSTAAPRLAVTTFQAKSEASREATRLYRDAVKALLTTVRDTYRTSQVQPGGSS